MNNLEHSPRSQRRAKRVFLFIGLVSLVWLLLRSSANPRRLAYPCQRAALVNSLGFIGCLPSLLGFTHIYRSFKQRITLSNLVLFGLVSLITLGITSSIAILPSRIWASPKLPAWIGSDAVSDVFAVMNVPVPQCSLNGGTLPASPPCNSPEYALQDEGVNTLINLMQSQDTHFYKTASHQDGILGINDVVVIKVNNQWGGRGSNEGVGRLATNTDVLKGLIWRILQHPDGFGGEIVVAENTQPSSATSWNVYPANAQDQGQSFQDVVFAFQSLGYPVSLYNWTSLNGSRISGGTIGNTGYPPGEYIQGNMSDAYIMLEDSAGTATDELSYPKFQTASGNYVSMCYGVWNGTSYDSKRLTFINLPVLKRHGMAGATIAWKNLIGFITADGSNPNRYGSYSQMHDFFWGYTGGPDQNYGLLGREMAFVRAPDLNVVDAIWVAYESNYNGDAVRQDVLLASVDPFAVDWYTSEYVLFPLTGRQATSAARSGTFRDATRTNQNSAKSVWPDGSDNYPYIDLLDAYEGSTPSDVEIDQLNVYVATTQGIDHHIYLPVIFKQETRPAI